MSSCGPRYGSLDILIATLKLENIARLKQAYLEAGRPVVNMNAKKKGWLDHFYGDGLLHAWFIVTPYFWGVPCS